MRKTLILFLFVFTSALFSQDLGIINGKVTDKETQNPILEATV